MKESCHDEHRAYSLDFGLDPVHLYFWTRFVNTEKLSLEVIVIPVDGTRRLSFR